MLETEKAPGGAFARRASLVQGAGLSTRPGRSWAGIGLATFSNTFETPVVGTHSRSICAGKQFLSLEPCAESFEPLHLLDAGRGQRPRLLRIFCPILIV